MKNEACCGCWRSWSPAKPVASQATKEIEQIVENIIQIETGEVVRAMELGTT